MSRIVLTFTKTMTDLVDDFDIKGTILANEKAGYTLTDAVCPERGEYLGTCEGCGMPIFDKDGYELDHESGVYTCAECADEVSGNV